MGVDRRTVIVDNAGRRENTLIGLFFLHEETGEQYMNRLICGGMLFFQFISQLPCQTSGPVPPELSGLDDYITSAMKQWNVPGLAISVIKDGNIIHSKGYGVRNLVSGEPVTDTTLFSIASATKSFTATVAAMVVDEGTMNWDTPLSRYFPDFRMYDSAVTDRVTLRDLLSHRSGIPRQKYFSLNTPPTRREVRACLEYFEPSIDFRSAWQYCNETVTVAGDMVAERAGSTWEEFVRTRIFDPLGMKRSCFSVTEMVRMPDYALPYIDWEDRPEVMDFHNADILGPAGCIVSNVRDLSQWLLLNLNKGKLGENQLVRPQRLVELQTPTMPIPASRSRKSAEILCQSYGMGWFIDAYRGHLHIHHGGVLYGFTSLVSFLPDDRIGLVVLANLNGTALTEILEGYVYDRLMGLDPIDWNQRNLEAQARMKAQYEAMKQEKDPNLQPETPLSHTLREYTGIFRSNGYGTMTIVCEGDSLHTTLLGIRCPLRRYNHDVFELYHPIEHQSWLVSFSSDMKGGISSLSVELGPKMKPIEYRRFEE